MWHAASGAQVSLVPLLEAGDAGWCMQTTTRTVTSGLISTGRACPAPSTTTGPIVAETCQGTVQNGAVVFVLTTREVAAVSIDEGTRVPTVTNSALPNGLRSAALQAPEYQPPLGFFRHCPTVTPLGPSGKAIRTGAGRGKPLFVRLPSRTWAHPENPPHGVCTLDATKLRVGTVAIEGAVATTSRPVSGLLGRALVSCARTVYVHRGGHDITAAVLLDASDPGAPPPPLPEMTPLAGHPTLFEAQGSEGRMVARRLPGEWVVVSEETPSGLAVPVELLEHMRINVQL
jgi:hypothetical protein